MALPDKQIFLRSPYYVNLSRANLEKIVVELWIYTGELTTDKPAEFQYRLESTAFPDESGIRYAEIDIAEMARDYVEVSYDGVNESNAVWIEYDLYYADEGDVSLTLDESVQLTGLEGYGYFEDGYNPQPSTHALLSNNTILIPDQGAVDIPILQDKLTDWSLAKNSVQTYASGALTPTENTANVVFYADTGLSSQANPDRAIFSFTDVSDITIYLKYYEECRNTDIQCSFINRFGAVQDVWFRGRSTRRLSTTEERYKRNILDNGTYNTQRHQDAILNKNGKTTIRVNTGYVPEEMNAVFQELMLSERVWITVPDDYFDLNANKGAQTDTVQPVNIVDTSFTFLEKRYQKLINYSFTMEYGADRINSVR